MTRAASRYSAREQPPVGGLAAVAQLELDRARRRRRSAATAGEVERRVLAREHADQLGAVARAPPAPCAQRRCGLAPGDDLLADEADGLAAREAPARRRRGPPGATAPVRTPRERLVQRAARSRSTPRSASQRERRASAGLLAGGGDDHDLLVRELRGALGGHDHVRAVGQHHDLLGGHLVDRRRAARRSRG